jgi:hypothetical protein
MMPASSKELWLKHANRIQTMTTHNSKVLITVNPGLLEGKRFQTVRSLVSALDQHTDLLILPIDGYDFKSGRCASYKRIKGGRFKRHKVIIPQADLWVVYTDGYYIDTVELGYRRRIDYLKDQFNFHNQHVRSGQVKRLINSTESEKRTLKNWFATLDCKKLGIIPTFKAKNRNEILEALAEHKTIVTKPDWGGDGIGVRKLENKQDADDFLSLIGHKKDEPLEDWSFQIYQAGEEKRLWFLGNQCIGGRTLLDRKPPWSPDKKPRATAKIYEAGKRFERDKELAHQVWQLSGLEIGSVDFMGDDINEINGCGTLFTCYNRPWIKVADARPALIDYVLGILN